MHKPYSWITKEALLFWCCITAIVLVSVYLRVEIPDYNRLGNVSDEAVNRNAAFAIHADNKIVFIRDPEFFLSNDIKNTPASTNLNVGYPYFLSLLNPNPAGVPVATYLAQAILSLFITLGVIWSLFLLNVNRFGIIIGFCAISFYPGLIQNIDRVLTEYLFTFLLVFAFCMLLLGSKLAGVSKFSSTQSIVRKTDLKVVTAFAAAGILLGLSGQVRALSVVFCPIILTFIFVYLQRYSFVERSKIGIVFCLTVAITYIPFILYAYGIEGQLKFIPGDSSYSPKVWGLVPYLHDMQATDGMNMEQVAQCNKIASPSVFWAWRLFGMLEYGWGQMWDENFRFDGQPPLLSIIHYIVVLPAFIAAGLFLRRLPNETLLISSVPVMFTLIYMQFHTLPRYMLPAVPFLIILFGCVSGIVYKYIYVRIRNKMGEDISAVSEKSNTKFFEQKETIIAKVISYSASWSLIILGVLIMYSTSIFAWKINDEMSKFELARYFRLNMSDLDANYVIGSEVIGSNAMIVENALSTDENNSDVYESTDLGHSIVSVPLKLPNAPQGTVAITKVDIHMKMYNPIRSNMTVYFTRDSQPRFNERRVFARYPINKFEDKQTLVFGDADLLTIVPATHAESKFEVDFVEAVRYAVPMDLQNAVPEYCKIDRH